MRLNQAIVGLLIGLVMPLLGFVVVYLVMARDMSLAAYLQRLATSTRALGSVISLSVLANLIPFLLFSRRRLDQALKGVVIATMLYAVAFLYVKFVAS